MVAATVVSALIPHCRSGFMQIATLVVFTAAPFFGLVALRYGEPILLRRMLRRAVLFSRARGGFVLLSSVRDASAVVNAFLPVDGSLLPPASRSDEGARGASRLVAVRVAEGVELRAGSGGELLVAKVPHGQFSLAWDGERTSLEVRPGGSFQLRHSP